MREKREIPRIPSTAIALLALLLGAMFAFRIMRVNGPGSVWATRLAEMRITGIEVLTISILVVVLIIIKTIADFRYQTEQSLLEAFLENMPHNVFFKDRESRFIRINDAMADYFGLSDPSEAVGKSDADMFTAEHAQQAFADEQEIIRTGQPAVGREEKETWPDGRESWVLTTKVPLRNRHGQIIGTMGIARDITERMQAEARIRYMALHDALTGLPNRTLLQDRLSQAISLASRNQVRVAVMMLDLDRFKYVNDSLGHYVGDRLLEAVSVRLQACLRESDIVARLGGDEFVVALPLAASDFDTEQVARKILAAIAEPFEIEGHELHVKSSIGICHYPADGENAGALLQAADSAMYEAKAKGRGTYCFCTPGLNAEAKRRQKLEVDLRKAVVRQEFVLHYQPLVSADTGRITGMEALLRWNHPEEGLVFPNQFIPVLEELGLMTEVGQWALLTACRQNFEWQRDGLDPVRMAVNVSAQQFHRGNIISAVTEALNKTGLDPRWLELEITESLTLDDTENTILIMRDLKMLGVSLSLDDFGTGWSSLAYLRRFPLDRIKIDRSFMRDVVSQPAAEAVVRGILSLARNLGIACVGEGVETRLQLEYLQRQMCPEIQGYLYSPALPPGDCTQLMRAGKAAFLNVASVGPKRIHVVEPSTFGSDGHDTPIALREAVQ
jgi:diguanylate cyclase (GGDEF)-like protein/PAS domain S-box-containing protein